MNDGHDRLLARLNMKKTPKRLAILQVLAAEERFLSPEEVRRELSGNFASIGLPTVYRNLEEMADGGVITKILHPNRQLYYFFCGNNAHHHHFICLSCRKVADLPPCDLEGVEAEVTQKMGGKVLSHILQVNGLCSSCSGEQA